MSNMKDSPDQRRNFLDFLADSGAIGAFKHPGREGFISGVTDISLTDLEIDSLALMEIGIGLEDHYGVSFSPHEISQLPTLGSFWSKIVLENGSLSER